MREQLKELESEARRSKPNKDKIAEEFGDLVFALANFGRHLGIDAEASARSGSQKFADRFSRSEKELTRAGKKLPECSRRTGKRRGARSKANGNVNAAALSSIFGGAIPPNNRNVENPQASPKKSSGQAQIPNAEKKRYRGQKHPGST